MINHPQTVIHIFNDNTCLFLCYLYCCGLQPDSISGYLRYYADAYDKGFLSEEGYVKDAVGLIRALTGRKVNVTKKKISSIADIKNPTPVRYQINQTDEALGHFVVVENGKIVFNPLTVSNQVNNGKPYTARVIEYA